jgi:pyruvate dehydrogenase E2 component (dihydrolipoamide acetyltransferase)
VIAEKGETVAVAPPKGEEKGEAVKAAPRKEVSMAAVPPKPKSVGVVGELEEAPEEAPVAAAEKKAEPAKPAFVSEHALATPAVRALARELGVKIDKVQGTGSGGRVLEKDVRQAAESRERPEEKVEKPAEKPEEKPAEISAKARKYDLYGYVERIPLKGVRRSIAKAMVKSKYTAPHVTAIDEADITDLWEIREKEKKAAEKKGIKLTILPFIIKGVIAGLKEHPYLNATLNDENEEIILKKYFNIGLATDTPEGLMVPVIKNADGKSIIALAEENTKLAEMARTRKIDLADLKGGTFTITNYGSVRGIYGTPIINHPEVAILGVGKIKETPVVRDGKIVIRKILPLSLSFDHRVVDGAEAARFLNTVIARLEDPDLILLET